MFCLVGIQLHKKPDLLASFAISNSPGMRKVYFKERILSKDNVLAYDVYLNAPYFPYCFFLVLRISHVHQANINHTRF